MNTMTRTCLFVMIAIGLLAPASPPASGFQGQGRFAKKHSKAGKRRTAPARRVPETDQELSDLAKAASAVRKYRQEIKSALDAAHQPLGPFRIEGSCSWCSSQPWWALGACVETSTRTVSNNVDFGATRATLVAVLRDADAHAAQSVERYSDTETWIRALPEFSRKFNRDADVILGIQQQIKAGIGPTDEQREAVKEALDSLTETVETAADTLTSGSTVLVESLERQSQFRESIRQALADARQSGDRVLAQLTQSISADLNAACANNIARNNFEPIRGEFLKSAQSISSAFEGLEDRSRDVEAGLGALLGTLQSNLTELKAVSDLVKAAQTDRLGNFLATIRLNAAKKIWAVLADARRQP